MCFYIVVDAFCMLFKLSYNNELSKSFTGKEKEPARKKNLEIKKFKI
jgi:hypothetical protein